MKHKKQSFNFLAAITGESFDFVSPMPLEQCAKILEDRSECNEGMFASRRKLKIVVTAENMTLYDFKMHRSTGRVDIRCKGILKQIDEQSTQVAGVCHLSPFDAVVIFLIPVFMIIALSLINLFPMILIVIFILTPILSLLFMAVERSKMVKIVYDVLSEY